MGLTTDSLALETWTGKLKRKFRENPFVPIGVLGTCGVFYMAARRFNQGNARGMNYWLRWRVGMQGATLVALVIGTVVMKRNQRAEAEAIAAGQIPDRRQTSVEKARDEFAERLRDAEAMHEEEADMRNARVRREISDKAKKISSTGASSVASVTSEEDSSRTTWWRRWWSSSDSKKP